MDNLPLVSKFSAYKSGQDIVAWNLTKAYDSIKESSGISKKSLERLLLSSGLLAKEVNQDLGLLTPVVHIKEYWERLTKKQRYLFLEGCIHSFKDSKILFFQDKRRTRYWIPLSSSPSLKEWELALPGRRANHAG